MIIDTQSIIGKQITNNAINVNVINKNKKKYRTFIIFLIISFYF